MTVQDRVADGVAILDEMRPAWAEYVDLETLEMSIDTCCVLGHVYGSFDAGCMELNRRHAGESQWEGEHGFNIVDWDEDWAPIQAEWVRVITARQAAAMPDVLMLEEPALD